MLHDKFLPEYQFSEKHAIRIARPPEKIFPLITEMDFSGSWIIRTLYKLRGMTSGMTLKKELLKHFMELEQCKDQELVIGLIGQFWKLNGSLKKVAPEEFTSFHESGYLKATWNFELIPQTETSTILETETRVHCSDAKSHRLFSRYWFFVRPFSGLIRKEMLRSIRKKAEQADARS
jgi:hypothetical protein